MFQDKQIASITDGSDATQYLKSARAGGWVTLALVAVALAFLVAWSMLGTITVTTQVTAIKQGDRAASFISVREGVYNGLALGQVVRYDGAEVGRIAEAGRLALTPEQVQSAVANDEYFEALQPSLGPYNVACEIEIDPECAPDGPLDLDVVLSEMRPYELLAQ